MLYVRSWAVLMCNIPHERVFKASRSNNFYFALLLLMLFLVTLPLIYLLMVVQPSLDCGPFSGLEKSYYIFTNTIEAEFPSWLNRAVFYVASPGVILPVFLLMSKETSSHETRSGNIVNLRISFALKKSSHFQERTEEKRKIYAMADARAKRSFQLRQQQRNDVNSPLLSFAPNPSSRSAVSRYGSIEAAPKPESSSTRMANAQVIRVPNLTEQQAAALRRQNPNIHVITASEARIRGLLPLEESSVTSLNCQPGIPYTSHITPPIAIVQGEGAM
ncbi:hypothetical protein LSH36_1073g00009 [Paralvinella palmiformis]|uniref:Uncharacterized protein n=1 Tax=Paralvinella palmiformis TaxID=53620 RepID=A0AAD9IVZ6_9ANNE|nr:hypothetical protein LSH36_1073g00009 [Paralvinella palmiformis]